MDNPIGMNNATDINPRDIDIERATCIESPPWTVMAVFDPDGNGSDFAYTVGLKEFGSPELHLWARPTDGFDPGYDFVLSARDMCGILNRCASQKLGGELGVGTRFSLDFDDGMAKGHFVAAGVVPAADVEAYLAGDDTDVISIRWSLER